MNEKTEAALRELIRSATSLVDKLSELVELAAVKIKKEEKEDDE